MIGSLITINTTGLDFAMTALFVVIVLEQFLTNEKHLYTYIGFIISILCLVIFGSESFYYSFNDRDIIEFNYPLSKRGKRKCMIYY